MNVYFWCLAIMYSMQMLTMGITQYVVFNTVTPTQAVIVMGVVSLFMSSAAYLMDKDYIKEMVWKYRYTIIVVEGSTTVILSIVVFLVGVTQEMLIARWIVLGTICEVLAFAIRFLFERMKEQRGDGSNVATRKDVFVSAGCTIGHVLAISVMLIYPDVNKDYILYAHGFLMCIENIGIWFWLKDHDKKYNKPKVKEIYMGDI